MSAVTLTLPEPPSSNRYWRHAKGRTYVSAEALAYRQEVAAQWLQRPAKMRRKMTGAVRIDIRWYRSQKRGDLDNRIKQVLDALQGLAYDDDKHITEIHAYRLDDAEAPRMTVTLTALCR